MVEGFLEERDAGEVCVREVYWAEGLLPLSRAPPHWKPRAGVYRVLTPAHHVESARESRPRPCVRAWRSESATSAHSSRPAERSRVREQRAGLVNKG